MRALLRGGGRGGEVPEPRDEDGGGDQARLHLREEVREARGVELVAEVLAEEALARGVDDERGHVVEQVDRARLALEVLRDVLTRLGLDRGDEVAELGDGELLSEEVELLAHARVRRAVGDALAEDGDHEGVRLARREDLVARLEEVVVQLRVGDEGDAVAEHVQREDAAELLLDADEEVARVDAKAHDVADEGDLGGQHRGRALGRVVEADELDNAVSDAREQREEQQLDRLHRGRWWCRRG